MNRILILGFLLLIFSCTDSDQNTQVVVRHAGALKNFMQKGDVSAKADLDTLNYEHLYALGALSQLKGEILIIDGKPFISRDNSGVLTLDNTHQNKAALLVYANIKNWRDYKISEPLHSSTELESYVEESALKAGLDMDMPFPFLIKGKADAVNWHVINWPDGDTEHTHKKHVESGLHGILSDGEVTILGFYSRHHHAVFTHHSTNLHMHVLTNDESLAAHVDDIAISSQCKLYLPK